MSSQLAPALVSPVPQPSALLRLLSDERLLEHVRTGSERAFDVLYDRHHPSLLAFCRHMLGSHHEAEDAVQHVFFAAYRGLMRSDRPIAPRPWLFAIARNRCVSVLRARRERPVDEVPERLTEHLATEVDRREDLRSLLIDLARLPDDERAALLLAEVVGMSHAEIGRILGCRRERVKALVFQARTSLLDDRIARDAPCDELREHLACLSGAALRRTVLRRHLRECAGCRDFRDAVRRQRRVLAAGLPMAPGLALKQAALGAGTAAWGGSGGTALLSGTLGGVVAKALVVVALTSAGGAAMGATRDGAQHGPPTTSRQPAVAPVSDSPALTGNDRRPSTPATLGPSAMRPERSPSSSNPDRGSARSDSAAPSQALPPRDDGAAPTAFPTAPGRAAERGEVGAVPAPARPHGPPPRGLGVSSRVRDVASGGGQPPSRSNGRPAHARPAPSRGSRRAGHGADSPAASPALPQARPPHPSSPQPRPRLSEPASRPAAPPEVPQGRRAHPPAGPATPSQAADPPRPHATADAPPVTGPRL